ncbi:MAG: bifunctional riboflavin kinase/FAD synthetase [Candidatus Binatia bacterium]
MRIIRSLARARGCFFKPVITIGNFDGVHRGHQEILRQVCEDAAQRRVAAVALTFEPHPIAVLRPEAAPRRLMTLGDRLKALESYGLDATVVQWFSRRFAAISADDFVRGFLVETLDVQKAIVGHDLNFGCDRGGSAESLVEAGATYGFSVEVVRPVEAEGLVVHSSMVREAVARGEVELAAKLLGRPHTVRGIVVRGEGRGADLGFPTANIRPKTSLPPGNGVYATRALLDGEDFDGVTSIGAKPTFGGTRTVVETHLFREQGELYGRNMALRFIAKIRDQRKFASPEELVARVARDVEEARSVLNATRP